MARTKSSLTGHTHSFTTVKDPWDVEHENLLQRNLNALAHSDTIYPGLVHKGFDADATAEEFIRRYPIFSETEEHREFLVRSISERFIIAGERDDYFTPEQLWDEDDRVNGKKVFSRNDGDISSEVESEDDEEQDVKEVDHEPVILTNVPKGRIGEDQTESNEELAQFLSDPVEPGPDAGGASTGPAAQQPADVEMTDGELAELFGEEQEPEPPTLVVTMSEAETEIANDDKADNDSQFPITVQGDDHTTTITHDYSDVQRTLASLDLSPEAKMTAVTRTSLDGSLVLAIHGHAKADRRLGDLEHPISVDDSAANQTGFSEAQESTENPTASNEWNAILQRAHRPTVAFLSGTKTYSTLVSELRWDMDSIVATTVTYKDGRVLVLLVGEQSKPKSFGHATTDEEADPAERFEDFFGSMRKHNSIPPEHSALASILQVAHKDMIEAGTLATLTLSGEATDSSENESEIMAPARGDRRENEQNEARKQHKIKLEKKVHFAEETKKLLPTRSSSFSKERMRLILQPPSPDYAHLSHVNSAKKSRLASIDKENRPQGDTVSSQNQRLPQQVSGFPTDFTKIQTIVSSVENPESVKANPHPPTRKRRRASSPEDNNESDDDDDDDSTRRPQRKRKIAKTKATDNTKPRPRGRPPKAKVQASASARTEKKKKVNKAMTAAESEQSIAEVRARLDRFRVPTSSGSASPVFSRGGETVAMEENDGEESEKE